MALGPQWKAVQREAQLAAAQVAQGITVLGHANHAQSGLYAQAFFGISIGLERLGKLIFVADFAVGNNGRFPTDEDLRKIGHDVSSLLAKCEEIGQKLNAARQYAARPTDAIHMGIAETLSLFATKLRYYNLNYLAGSSGAQQDPIALWWEKVAKPICARHYSERQRQEDDRTGAMFELVMGGHSAVIHTSEEGAGINSLYSYASRRQMTSVVQKYGRFYTLQIVRWLASIVGELSFRGAYELRIEALLGLNEPFSVFCAEDSVLRNRKAWSSYPR
jgi:hypothetical protein